MSDWLNNPTDIKYCRQCGTPMRAGAAFCPGCGAKQPERAASAAGETPAVETPTVETPAAETPTVETPAAETPAAETPAAETPAAETPAVETPAQPPVPPVYYTPEMPQPPRKKKSGTLVALLSVACAVLVLGMAVLTAWVIIDGPKLPTDTSTGVSNGAEDSQPDTTPSQVTTETPGNSQGETSVPELIISGSTTEDGGLTTSQIVRNNLDSTVVLTMYQNQRVNSIFGSSSEKMVEVGTASGVIMTADGYIITNAHCVADTETSTVKQYDRIDVKLYNEKTYTATVVGYDTTTDLAVIKIDAADLKPAQFGDSSQMGLGDRVVVLGNGAGFGWSCTEGIVSGFGRDVYADTGYAIKCIQTDAIINPGNSGGALLNNMGQVIGINSAKIVASGYEGIGFSIPINEAKTVIDDLIKYGYVKGRVAIGVTGMDTNLEGYEGYMIESIDSASSLVSTEAQRGDIITAVDGETVTGYSDLRVIMARHKAGDTVVITLRRLEFDRTGRYILSDTTFTVNCTLQEITG